MSEAKRLSEPSLTRIKDWVRDQGFQIGPKSIADLLSHIAALEAELAAAKAECERLQKELDDARTELRRRLETVRHALDTSEDPLTVILAVLERMCGV